MNIHNKRSIKVKTTHTTYSEYIQTNIPNFEEQRITLDNIFKNNYNPMAVNRLTVQRIISEFFTSEYMSSEHLSLHMFRFVKKHGSDELLTMFTKTLLINNSQEFSIRMFRCFNANNIDVRMFVGNILNM